MKLGKPALAVVGVSLLSIAAAAQAASVDPLQFQELKWRSVGPFRGGRVLAVEGALDDPKRFYFGAVNGGVWRTDDAGRTWAPIFDAVNVGSIGAIAVAPSAPKTHLRRHRRGRHALRHRAGHRHVPLRRWRCDLDCHRAQPTRSKSAKILVDPRNPKVLLVAALGHPYGPNAERGVFRSSDGGAHWTQNPVQGCGHRRDRPGVRARPIRTSSMPRCGRRGGRRGTPIRRRTGPGSGLYKSIDGGKTLAPADRPRLAERARPHRPRHQPRETRRASMRLIDSDERTGRAASIARTIAGSTWTKVTGDKRIWNRGWYFGEITAESEKCRPALGRRTRSCSVRTTAAPISSR